MRVLRARLEECVAPRATALSHPGSRLPGQREDPAGEPDPGTPEERYERRT